MRRDADDLPEYGVRLFDQHLARPEPLRIGLWDALERGGAGMRGAAIVRAKREKVAAIAAAQRAGRVSDALAAATLLELVIAISQTGPVDADPRLAPVRARPPRRRQGGDRPARRAPVRGVGAPAVSWR